MSEKIEPEIDRLDSFNARDMTATQVVDRFVQPAAYSRMRAPGNTLLMGPRGSGKTTLLKMLTPEAAERRAGMDPHETAPEFGGVYVPIDVQLAARLEALSMSELPPDLVEVAVKSIYAFHVFRCIAETISWHCPSARRHSRVALLSLADEASTVDSLADLWNVRVAVPTIGALQRGIRTAQARAIERWTEQQFRVRVGLPLETASFDFLDLDTGIKGAIEILCGVATWDSGKRWAVLFDEVEVAPELLQRHLLSYLRYSDTSVLFKVAISPYMQAYRGLPDGARGSAMNDYLPIDLQSSTEAEIETFSEAFFRKATKGQDDVGLDIYASLGPSVLTGSSSHDAAASYGPAAPQAKIMRALARKDESFWSYLRDHELTPDDLVRGSESNERAPFRKARQVALVRESFISSNVGTRRLKGRTSSGGLYTGAVALIRMCEGNPRRLAFITPLLIGGINERGLVPYRVQAEAVQKTQTAFRSFLRGLPITEELGRRFPRGVLTFADAIGSSFHQEIIAPEFDDDPVASFIVDSNASEDIERLLALGVNSGAFVQLSDSDGGSSARGLPRDPIVTSRGKRFRLSYLLSPGYGLTLRVGRAISLNSVLDRKKSNRSTADAELHGSTPLEGL